MPGLTQAMVFKYSFRILPMANPAWCVLLLWVSWFFSVFCWQLRRAVSQQKMSLPSSDNQGKRSVFLLCIHQAQRVKVGSSSPPMALLPLCMVTRLGLSHVSEGDVTERVAPQLVHEHLPPLPGFAGTQCWGALFMWTHKNPAVLPLGGEENSGKHGIDTKSNYLITKQ